MTVLRADRKTIKKRLEKAGFVHLSGWVPVTHPAAARFEDLVEKHSPAVERIISAPGSAARGRPKIPRNDGETRPS